MDERYQAPEGPELGEAVVEVAGTEHPGLMDRLRAETRQAHEHTEAIPYSRSIVEETLPLSAYIAQLRCLRRVFAALEPLLAETNDRHCAEVWHQGLAKLELLDRDLAYFADTEPDLCAAACSGEPVADAWVCEIKAQAERTPAALLGTLYVLEGSTLGGMVLAKHLESRFQLSDGQGLHYYRAYGRDVRARWLEFKERMDAAVDVRSVQDNIVDNARGAFLWVGRMLRSHLD